MNQATKVHTPFIRINKAERYLQPLEPEEILKAYQRARHLAKLCDRKVEIRHAQQNPDGPINFGGCSFRDIIIAMDGFRDVHQIQLSFM